MILARSCSNCLITMVASTIDRIGKGCIDINEVKRLLNVFKSSIPPAMASRIIAEVDVNGDGQIDFSGSDINEPFDQ